MPELVKILILEDSDVDAEIEMNLLRGNNFNIDSKVVMTKDDFIIAIDNFKPDIILSDNSMPQFSATDALEIILDRKLYIPFILVTGSVSEEFAAKMIKLGADDYILKDRLARLPAAITAALQKRKARLLIKHNEEQVRFKADLLSTVGQAVIATDLEGLVIYWNKAAQTIYGWSSEEAVGRQVIELAPSQNKHRAKAIIEYLKEGNLWMGDLIVQRKDGSTFPAFVTNSPIYDPEGNLTGVVSVSSDITEQKKAHEELRALEKHVMESQIQQQKLITRAVIKAQEEERNHIGKELHDNINQILAGTKLYLGTVAQRSAEMESVLKYPLNLIENSMEEIRLLSARHVTPVKNINLENLVMSLLQQLEKSMLIKTLFIYTVDTALNDELKLNIYRIIQEQVNNITKHASASNVTVLLDEINDSVLIDVMDDGKGFNTSAKRNGIGISNMMNRIDSFNGKIEIKSSIGNGSRIKVMIPLQ